jgi:hypothetical protein
VNVGEVGAPNAEVLESSFRRTFRPAALERTILGIEKFFSVQFKVCISFCIVSEGYAGSAIWPRAMNCP